MKLRPGGFPVARARGTLSVRPRSRHRSSGRLFMWAVLVIAAGVAAGLIFHGSSHASEREECLLATVGRGDTIWDIAARMARDDVDIRRVVYEIRVVNDLRSTTVMPGDILKIPAKWCR